MKTPPTPQQQAWLDEIAALEAQIAPIKQRIAELKAKELASRSRFKIGDIIKWSRGTWKGEVVAIIERFGEPCWRVRRTLKNGTQSGVYDVRYWDDPVLVKAAQEVQP